MKRFLLTLLLAVSLLFVSAAPAWADDGGGGKVIFGDNFTLKDGETIDGDLVVLGGNVTVEDGATVTGSVVVFGGSVEMAGRVEQDVTVIGGSVRLLETAVVEGALSTAGGSISKADGAQVLGGENEGFTIERPRVPAAPSPVNMLLNVMGQTFSAGVLAVVAGVLALALMAFLPAHTTRVSAALTSAPIESGLLGFLTLLALPIVLVIVTLTICLSPLSLIGGVMYGAALFLGWVALGLALGNRTAQAFKQTTLSPAVWAAGGTFVLTLAVNLLGVMARVGDMLSNYGGWPVALVMGCANFFIPLTLASLGMGAVVITRFGAQPYFKAARPAPVAAVSSEPTIIATPEPAASEPPPAPSEPGESNPGGQEER